MAAVLNPKLVVGTIFFLFFGHGIGHRVALSYVSNESAIVQSFSSEGTSEEKKMFQVTLPQHASAVIIPLQLQPLVVLDQSTTTLAVKITPLYTMIRTPNVYNIYGLRPISLRTSLDTRGIHIRQQTLSALKKLPGRRFAKHLVGLSFCRHVSYRYVKKKKRCCGGRKKRTKSSFFKPEYYWAG